ncbi:MAG: AbrB/MazE/SpoVT family DNA-binding domain-containing protein [Holophagales bacterium]|nr:AbrB/MazE/SpoVT family DNA-binding domain-containing protein [Holophagales bacterium]
MVISRAKLTSKHQITIPAEARRRLGLRAGDTVFLALEDGKIVLRGLPRGWTESYRGLGAELWAREGGGRRAIQSERESWEEE